MSKAGRSRDDRAPGGEPGAAQPPYEPRPPYERPYEGPGFDGPTMMQGAVGEPAGYPGAEGAGNATMTMQAAQAAGFGAASYGATPSAAPAGAPPYETMYDGRYGAGYAGGPGRQPYGDHPYADHPYADQSYGDHPYGDHPYGGRPYDGQPYGDQAYAGQPYADRPYGDQAYGDQFYGGQPYGDPPYGEQSYGEQPYGGDPGYAARQYGAAPAGSAGSAAPAGEPPYETMIAPAAPAGGPEDPAGPERPAPRRKRRRGSGRKHTTSLLDRIPRSPMFLALYGAVAFVLVASGGTFFALHRSYTVTVDGKPESVGSFSHTVNGVLSSAGVSVGNDDLVWPSGTSSVGNGDTIVVRHARPLTITMGGKTRKVMTTALTVGEAMEQLRLTNSAVLNASRDQALPASRGFALRLRPPKRVIILLDQVRLETETTATTVGGVLKESGIKLGKHDKVNKKLSAKPKQDMVLRVRQLISKPVTKTKHVDPPVKKKKDPTMTVGKKKVVDKGKSGIKQVVTAYVMHRGHKVRRVIATTWKRHPQPKIVKVGTKPATSVAAGGGGAPAPSGSPKAIAKQLLPSYGWSDQFGCLDSLWTKESGWNVHASNPSGAYGIPQALPGSKMASAGPDWQNNATTQIKWGLGYIKDRYGSPCAAWSHSESSGWY